MKFRLLAFFVILFVSLEAQPLSWDWGRSGGGPGNDKGIAIATDPSGFSYVTGQFFATLTIGSNSVTSYGGPDIFVAKFDPNGNCIWLRNGGSSDNQDTYGDNAGGISLDSAGNCYVTGYFKGTATFGSQTIGAGSMRNIFLVKYDTNGNEIWAVCPNGNISDHYSNAIDSDNSGNSWITGYLGAGNVNFGSFTLTGPGAFVVKHDTNGNVVFASKLGNGGNIELAGITVDNAGNSYSAGYLLTQETIGSQTFTSVGVRDAVLIKTDASGNFSWLSKSETVSGAYANGKAVCCDAQNGIYFCGHFNSTTVFGNDTLVLSTPMSQHDVFLVKYDSNGNEIWARQTYIQTNGGQTDGLALAANSNSEIFLTGAFGEDILVDNFLLPNPQSGVDTYVAEFTPSGICQYAISSGGINTGTYGQGISTDQLGGVYITGYAKSAVVFGTDTTQAFGGLDMVLAKIMTTQGKNGIYDQENTFQVSLFQHFSGNWILNFSDENLPADLHFVLYDMTGRMVADIPVQSRQQQIMLNGIANGMYSWMVTGSQNKIGAGRIVVGE